MSAPRHFPPDWRVRLDQHADLGWLNADELELLGGIAEHGDAWGLSRQEAVDYLARHRPLPPDLPQTLEELRKRAELAKRRGVSLEAAEELLRQDRRGRTG